MMKNFTALCVLAATLALSESVMVCYFGSWAGYRYGDGKFEASNIDPDICSHIIYAFAGLNTDYTIKVLDPYNDLCENFGKCGYDKFTALKKQNADLKTLLGVGGWNEGSSSYSNMAADSFKRKTFIDSTITLLKAHSFDGLDLDWMYPTQRGGSFVDRTNYITLLSELDEALHSNGMILMVGVSAARDIIDAAYDIPAIVPYVDLVNVMSYDYYGSWDPYTQHQSGLYSYPGDTGINLILNQNFSMNYWIDGGMPSTKLTMAVPTFARCWTLDNEANHGYYAPASNPGSAGPYTATAGLLGYNEICDYIKKESWTVAVEEGCNEPYAFSIPHYKIWCSYENSDSAAIKAQYVKDNNLAGVMVWSLEMEDFHGYCSDRAYDLIKTMVEVLEDDTSTTLAL